MTVKGYIYDKNGTPIHGASVYMKSDPTKGDATNSNGYFQFEVPNATKLVVKMLGYHQIEINSSTIALSYQLESNEIEIPETEVNTTFKPQSQKSNNNIFWWVLGISLGGYFTYSYYQNKPKKVKI